MTTTNTKLKLSLNYNIAFQWLYFVVKWFLHPQNVYVILCLTSHFMLNFGNFLWRWKDYWDPWYAYTNILPTQEKTKRKSQMSWLNKDEVSCLFLFRVCLTFEWLNFIFLDSVTHNNINKVVTILRLTSPQSLCLSHMTFSLSPCSLKTFPVTFLILWETCKQINL